MGSFSTEYIIYIREQDGSRTMFSAGELRDRLFLCLGDSQISDDITLALEYSLLNRQDRGNDLVFDRGEIDAAVVRLLEETGFPDAALDYRSGSDFEDESMPADSEQLTAFLSRHLSCSANRFEAVRDDVLSAARKIGITEASPHLYLELARYFSKRIDEEDIPVLEELPKVHHERLETLLQELDEPAASLVKKAVVSIECITAIFSCVRFHVSMREFSNFYDVTYPVTELLVWPAAEEVGSALEECRIRLVDGGEQLPCTLVIHELRQFVRDAFGCSEEQAVEQLCKEIGEAFVFSMGKNLFKLDFD